MSPDTLQVKELADSIRIYQFSDTHLQAHAASDPLLPDAWKASPKPVLPAGNEDLLARHLARAVEGRAGLILFCGDLFHFPSPENRDLVLRAIDACPLPIWTVPGNHDWFYPGQDGWEALRAEQLPRLDPVFGDSPSFWLREYQELRVLGLDNSTYFLTEAQASFLEQVLQDSSPLLLMLHIPISAPGLREATIAKHGRPILMADPEGRERPGVDPEPTRRAMNLLRESSCLRGIVSAHVHIPYVCEVFPGVPQWIAEAGYRDGYRWLECHP